MLWYDNIGDRLIKQRQTIMIDLKELRIAIQNMTYQQGLYKVLRDELKAKGYWRSLKRGNPKLGYQVMKAKKDKV